MNCPSARKLSHPIGFAVVAAPCSGRAVSRGWNSGGVRQFHAAGLGRDVALWLAIHRTTSGFCPGRLTMLAFLMAGSPAMPAPEAHTIGIWDVIQSRSARCPTRCFRRAQVSTLLNGCATGTSPPCCNQSRLRHRRPGPRESTIWQEQDFLECIQQSGPSFHCGARVWVRRLPIWRHQCLQFPGQYMPGTVSTFGPNFTYAIVPNLPALPWSCSPHSQSQAEENGASGNRLPTRSSGQQSSIRSGDYLSTASPAASPSASNRSGAWINLPSTSMAVPSPDALGMT